MLRSMRFCGLIWTTSRPYLDYESLCRRCGEDVKGETWKCPRCGALFPERAVYEKAWRVGIFSAAGAVAAAGAVGLLRKLFRAADRDL